jgi:hypothetical protein
MNFIKAAGVAAVAALSLGSLAACGTQHEINGQVVPTDAKKVCALLADDDGLGTGVGSDDGDTFTKKQYAEYRAWAKDINDEELSKGMLALAEFFEPGADEADFSDAMLIFGVYDDIAKSCDEHGVELPDLMDEAMSEAGVEDDTDWGSEEAEEAPDTERWMSGWCQIQNGMPYEAVVEIMGEPTWDAREGEGAPQANWGYGAYDFTVFFDTDDKADGFSGSYESLGETDLNRLDCIEYDAEYDMWDRVDN